MTQGSFVDDEGCPIDFTWERISAAMYYHAERLPQENPMRQVYEQLGRVRNLLYKTAAAHRANMPFAVHETLNRAIQEADAIANRLLDAGALQNDVPPSQEEE